jgi:hypothetical protein
LVCLCDNGVWESLSLPVLSVGVLAAREGHETRGKLLADSGDCNGTTTNEYVRFDTLFVQSDCHSSA